MIKAEDVKVILNNTTFICIQKKLSKERCHAKFLEGHLNELSLLIRPNKSGSLVDEAAWLVWANQEA